MDINTFYDLRTRLYATAAAGCGLIAEDFRLKRALEAFKPMSEVNKVFGRLYQMCEKLFDTENAAGELADCIALADALAVTQGSFLDKSDCLGERNKLCLKLQTISNRTLTEIQDTLLEGRLDMDTQYNLRKNMVLFLDPRVFPSFIQSLKRENKALMDMADILLPQLGDALIPILKEQIDFETSGAKNHTDCYVKLIARLYGEKENDWYIEMAENTEYPQSIRSAAVWALGRSEKNSEKLLELYKTQKGKIKNAAIFELARLNPPESEEIWKKLTEKYKDSNIDFIAWSKSDICAEFVRQRSYEIIEQFEKDYKEGKKRVISWYHAGIDKTGMSWIRKTICRKYQLEDLFHLFAEKYNYIKKMAPYPESHRGNWKYVINEKLIENLLEDDVRYSEMIKNLYQKHKEFYFHARFVLALKETKEAALEDYWDEMHKQRALVLFILVFLKYDFSAKKYFISWTHLAHMNGIGKELYQPNTVSAKEQKLELFDTFPERLISFAQEIDYFIEEQDAPVYDCYDEELPFSMDTASTIDRALSTLDVFDGHILNQYLPEADEECQEHETAEYKKCQEAVLKLAFEVNKYYSTGVEISIIERLYQGKPEKCKGLITNYVMQNIFSTKTGYNNKRNVYYSPYEYINKIKNLPTKDEDKKEELLELIHKIEMLEATSLDKGYTIDIIKRVLEENGWGGEAVTS